MTAYPCRGFNGFGAVCRVTLKAISTQLSPAWLLRLLLRQRFFIVAPAFGFRLHTPTHFFRSGSCRGRFHGTTSQIRSYSFPLPDRPDMITGPTIRCPGSTKSATAYARK